MAGKWKPAPPDPYYSLPAYTDLPPAAPSRPGRPDRPLPPLPKRAPPPSPFLAGLSLWVTVIGIPLWLGYTVFVQDHGEKEHIFSPARRWLDRQRREFYTLTPAQERLAGVRSAGSVAASGAEAPPVPVPVPVDQAPASAVHATSAEPVPAGPTPKKGWWRIWR